MGPVVIWLVLSLLSSAIGHHSHLLSNVSHDSTDCQHLIPPSFPPAIFCVDNHGCCKFSTVQAAVDAVPNNGRRNIIWIIGTFV